MLAKKKVDTKKLKNNPPKRDIVYQSSRAAPEEEEEDGPVLLNAGGSTRSFLKKKTGGAGVVKPGETQQFDAFGSRTQLTVQPMMASTARLPAREESLDRAPELTKA